jgi:hypothetical protein
MLNILRTELEKYGAFNEPSHEFINAVVRAVPFNTVPKKMKVVFAISHLSNFASQFRRSIQLWDGTLVPTNNISFVIADSGANKDSSNSKVRKCFKAGYARINEVLEEHVKEAAIYAANNAGEDMAEEFEVYRKYMKPIPPVFMSMTTGPGLIQHINDIGALPASAGMVYTGELSDELASNPHALDNIKTLAEVYDLGEKEVTYTKGVEFRSKEIKGQPVSALMVGSPGHILYDESTKKRFHIAFMSKMARRSWFCYAPERMQEPDFSSEDSPIQAMQEYEYAIEQEAKAAVEVLKEEIDDVTEGNLSLLGEPIPAATEVFELFNVYKRYNNEVINSTNAHETVYALVRGHLQWKALKLAGALAVMAGTKEVTLDQFITSIQYCEMFDHDITQFEKDINKVPHESLSDYLKANVTQDNKAFISIHDVKKLGFSSSVALAKLQELVSLCAGYDRDGVYTVAENASGVHYEAIVRTDVVGVSYKVINNQPLHAAVERGADSTEMSNVKNALASNANTGYTYFDTTFADLRELLKGDHAYSPFEFTGGSRAKANLVGGTKWLVIDVDKTTLSAEDAHFMLEGVNHHVALTSNPNNEYKYRVVIELDSYVELTAIAWKHFYTKISEDLGLDADVLPQSQIYFSYAGRDVLSCIDGTPLDCRDYIMHARDKEASGAADKTKTMSKGEKGQQLSDPMTTFWYAFDCEKGRRSVTLYRAARHAVDLGASVDETLDLLEQINNYLTDALDDVRYNKLVEQTIRLYGE